MRAACIANKELGAFFSKASEIALVLKLIAIIADSVWHTYYTPDQIFVARDKIFDARALHNSLTSNTQKGKFPY